jgi:DNA-binding NtrC family response regulator
MSAVTAQVPHSVASRTSVLIVEDDVMFSRLLGVFLDLDGRGRFDVHNARSVAEASAVIATKPNISSILLDLTLPDGRGLGTVRRVQKFAGDASIVVITGHDDADTALSVVAAGAQDYLVKGGLNGATVVRAIDYAVVRRRLELERDRLIGDLQRALGRVKKLEDLLPICANCKRIRNDAGDWERVEEYISQHTGTQFSHGICQPCARALYGEFAEPGESSHGR